MKISKIFDIFKRKQPELPPIPEDVSIGGPLPEDLERFRTEREPVRPAGYPEAPKKPEGYPEPSAPYEGPTSPYGGPVPELGVPPKIKEETPGPYVPPGVDKIDLILQKLDTIDTRLKLLEEKMRR